MPVLIFALLQTVPVADLPAQTPDSARATVATPVHVRGPCETAPQPDEIVVCGKAHDEQFRLRPIKRPPGMKAPIDGPGVDFDLGNAHGNLYAETAGRPDGLPDRRIMMTLTMPF